MTVVFCSFCSMHKKWSHFSRAPFYARTPDFFPQGPFKLVNCKIDAWNEAAITFRQFILFTHRIATYLRVAGPFSKKKLNDKIFKKIDLALTEIVEIKKKIKIKNWFREQKNWANTYENLDSILLSCMNIIGDWLILSHISKRERR